MSAMCVFDSTYSFICDIYDKQRQVSTRSGQTKESWVLLESDMPCGIQTIVSDGIRVAATTERFGDKYENIDWVTLKTKRSLSRSCRVTNIRRADTKELVWVEEELKDSPMTWFNVNGQAPTLDPFGMVIEWTGLLSRAEVQGASV